MVTPAHGRPCRSCQGSGLQVPPPYADGTWPPLSAWDSCPDCDGTGETAR